MGLSRPSWWLAVDLMLWKVFSSLDGSADPTAQLTDGRVFLHISGATQDQTLSTAVWSGEFFCSAINSIVYLKAFEAIRAQYHRETLGLCVRAQEYAQFRRGSCRSKSQMPAHNTKRRLLREPETTGKMMMMLPWLLEGFLSTPDVKYMYYIAQAF